MEAVNFALLILSALSYFEIATCVHQEPAVYLPPFEIRALRPGAYSNAVSPHVLQPQHYPSNPVETDLVRVTPVSEPSSSPSPHHAVEEHYDVSKNDSVSVRLLKALLNEEEEKKTADQGRAASGRDYEYPSYPQSPAEYGYPSRGYWPPAPVYQDAPYAYVRPTSVIHSPPPLPKLIFPKVTEKSESSSVDKPIASKLTNKVSGLIGLVLALLTGSTSDDSELKGIKDLVINGIVKPLMLAKGGIKSLISKLSIPLIVLLLVNLEVLVLIWWLWEDCQPAAVHHPVVAPSVYPYSGPLPSYGYNPY